MQEEDFLLQGERVNRLIAIKSVAGEFIQRRRGDRLGLILFGERAYLQVPLTFDRRTVQQLLAESLIGLAGQSTAIGDAIGLAIKRLQDPSVKQRVLILLTDGANTAGELPPLKAAELAAQKGLKIYTIGIGADRMLVRSLFGIQEVNPSRDLDEKTLVAIAQATGGRYFRARDTQELDQIYSLLDELEPVEREAQLFRPIQPLYPWPLAISLLLAALLLGLRTRREGP
jgi:Ca-activated chloride channel family protein